MEIMNIETAEEAEIAARQGELLLVPEELKTAEICMAAVRQDGMALKWVPEGLKTPEICMEAVKASLTWPPALAYVPEELKTAELCAEAVRRNYGAMEYVPDGIKGEVKRLLAEPADPWQDELRLVPDALKTPETCMEAVKRHGWELEFVPEELKTPELCMEAVRRAPWALHDVPEALRSPEICMAAVTGVNENFAYYPPLKCVPEALRTEELCMAAVRQDGRALEWVPEALKTPELCMEAVRQDGQMLEFVPEELRTEELCMAAVTAMSYSDDYNYRIPLQFVPEELKTEGMCKAAVMRHGRALEFVPEALKTEELCMTAAACFTPSWTGDSVLRFVPKDMLTPELCCESVFRSWNAASAFVPDDARPRTRELLAERLAEDKAAMEAARRNGLALQDVPKEKRTWRLCLEAVRQNGMALQHVPEWMRMPDVYGPYLLKNANICFEAVRQDGMALEFVPEQSRLADVCIAAVQQNPMALQWVPKKMMKPEIFHFEAQRVFQHVLHGFELPSDLRLEAVRRDGRALEFVPEELRTEEVCREAVRSDGRALEYVPEELKAGILAWTNSEALSMNVAAGRTNVLEAARAAFASCAETLDMPAGCLLAMETERLDGGRLRISVRLSDPDGFFYDPGTEPCASAVYRPGTDRAEADPAASLRLFADKLEGKSRKPVETMPARMKEFCAGAVRKAAEAAAAAASVPAEEEIESAGPVLR